MRTVLKEISRLYMALFLVLFSATILGQNIDPQSIISVEFKMGAADQGIVLYPDMLCGVPAIDVMAELNSMGINTLRIPVSNEMNSEAASVLVNFIHDLYENGGEELSILLSQRKWDLYLESQQEAWADVIAVAFNSLDTAGYGSLVKGCVFDENRRLDGEQSTKALWDQRHNGVLGAMDLLNEKTNNAFKTRTVFIHGKGYGSQFLGVKESSDGLNFTSEMAARCNNYAYTFKFFQVGDPSDKSLAGWTTHYRDYCKLSEVAELEIPLVFVGDPGDGLRPNSFVPNKNPYGGPGQYVIKALRDIFKAYEWSGFSIGPFLREGTEADMGQTILFSAYDGVLTERTGQTDSWWTWFETTRLPEDPDPVGVFSSNNAELFNVYPNPSDGDQIQIDIKGNELFSGISISIYTISGQLVYNLNDIVNPKVSIDISHYKAGVYFVQLSASEIQETVKLIVE